MRIIAGAYGSRPLLAPRGLDTRPTSGRLRETLFNVLGARIQGARFADLYAGSGAVGIEALSRGAAHVLFVESNLSAAAILRRNLDSLAIRSGFAVDQEPVSAALRVQARRQPSPAWDIVFLDPPYRASQEYQSTLEALGRSELMAEDGIVIVEHEKPRRGGGNAPPLEDRYGSLQRYRILEQGSAALSFYQMASVPPR